MRACAELNFLSELRDHGLYDRDTGEVFGLVTHSAYPQKHEVLFYDAYGECFAHNSGPSAWLFQDDVGLWLRDQTPRPLPPVLEPWVRALPVMPLAECSGRTFGCSLYTRARVIVVMQPYWRMRRLRECLYSEPTLPDGVVMTLEGEGFCAYRVPEILSL